MAAAISTTQMHADVKCFRCRPQHIVGDRNILVDQLAPVVTARGQRRLDVGVAELCEGRFVDLYVAAARLCQGGKFLVKRLDGVIPELIRITVGRGENRGIATAEMQRARTRNCDLGKPLRFGFQKVEIGNIDRMSPAYATFYESNRLGATSTAVRRASSIRTRDRINAQIAKLLIEKAVIRPATEFTVGDKLQTQALLQCHSVCNRSIFRIPQIGLRDFSPCEASAVLEKALRPQQTSNVLGTEWRSGRSVGKNVHEGEANVRARDRQPRRAF